MWHPVPISSTDTKGISPTGSLFASRTRSVSTCTVRRLGCAAFAAAKIVTASFNAGPVFSYITAILARGFKFSTAIFRLAADVDVNTRPSVTFAFFLLKFLKPHLVTAASQTLPAPRPIGACSPSFFLLPCDLTRITFFLLPHRREPLSVFIFVFFIPCGLTRILIFWPAQSATPV